MRGLHGMRDYAARAIDPYVNSREGFGFTAVAALEDAAGGGVRRLEMSFDVRAAGHYTAGYAGWAFIENLVKRHRHRIGLRPELGIAREIAGKWRVRPVSAKRSTRACSSPSICTATKKPARSTA